MRVLHVDHTGVVSGAEHSLLALMEVLSTRHEVVLAAPDGALLAKARAIGARTVVIPGTELSWKLHPLRTPRAVLSMLVSGAKLRRIAGRREFDVIHANSLRAALIACCGRVLGAPPFVAHVHDKIGEGLAAKVVKLLVARLAVRVAVVSEFVAGDWESVRGIRNKLAIVHNPIDCAIFVPDVGDSRAWRESAGIPLEDQLLAVVGPITPQKRQAYALEIFHALLEHLPRAQLLIVGEVKFMAAGARRENRAYTRQLEGQMQSFGPGGRVRMLGERADVPSIMRAVDLLMAPAVDEGFGRAVAEALASGAPVVVPARGGPSEFVRDGIDGVVVQRDEICSWVAGSRRALALGKAPALIARRHEHVRALFSTDGYAQAMEELLGAASARRRRARF